VLYKNYYGDICKSSGVVNIRGKNSKFKTDPTTKTSKNPKDILFGFFDGDGKNQARAP